MKECRDLKIGDKIKMCGERQRYTVHACDARFAIMSKPFNPKRAYLYTITDLERGLRGPCNYIFGPPVEMDNPTSGAEALAMLQAGEMEISYRRNKPLTDAERAQLV